MIYLNKLTKVLLLCSIAFTACDKIDQADRVKPIESQEQPKDNSKHIVLLEDYTGQKCSNCPVFADKLHKALAGELQPYSSRVVMVAVHNHLLPLEGSNLPTPAGEAYARWIGLSSVPAAVVDRTQREGKVIHINNVSDVVSSLKTALSKPQALDLFGKASFSEDRKAVTVEVLSTVAGNTQLPDQEKLKVQLWLVENNIEAYQEYPGGKHNDKHKHDHVLRAALNGTWGEAIKLGTKYLCTQQFPAYVLESVRTAPMNFRIVAFVFSGEDNTVLETIEIEIN